MAIFLKGKMKILEYFNDNGKIDIKSVALSTIEYLIKTERMTVKEIADLFDTTPYEVEALIMRNGL